MEILRPMPADRIATVQSIYERWAEGDFGATFDLLDQDVVFVIPPEFPDAGKYLGSDAIAEYTRGFLEPWTRITIEAEELLPAGDSVVASVLQRGVGDASGAETELRYLQLWTFRGEVVIRLQNFRDRGAALRAAGISG
jgi:ketosteroid isomerase-like protein